MPVMARMFSTAADFEAEDPRRARRGRWVQLGSAWMNGSEILTVYWLAETGELIAAGNPNDAPIEILGVCEQQRDVERVLRGWWQVCGWQGSFGWVRNRAATFDAPAS